MRLIDIDAIDFDGMGICEIMEALMDAPTIEPPVKRGEWYTVKIPKQWGGRSDLRCSACQKATREYYPDFCPGYGADMRKEEQA